MSELNVQVEELSPVVRRLRIDVPADRVSEVTDSVYRRLGQQVKLRGFRQGHVPRRVLEKYFADRVRNDVAREVMQATFPEALVNVKLSPVAEPTIEPEEVRPGEAFRYTARVEIRPEVKLGDYKNLEVTIPEHPVTEHDVDLQLEQLRQRSSTLVPIEGRDVAEMDDYANIDFEVEIPGNKPDKREGGLIQLTAGSFFDGHGEKLLGQKVGELRVIEEPLQPEAGPEKGGKVATIKITLTGLKRRELPVLDDEFAKDQPRGFETLAELRADLRREMEKRAAEETKTDRRNALVRKLVEKNPLEVPPALVDSAAEQMARTVIRNVTRGGMQLPGLEGILERVKVDALPKAAEDLKAAFLLDAVAKAEKLDITPEDVEARFKELATEEDVPVEKVKARYRNAEALAGLKNALRNDKALLLLEASAQVTIEAPKPAETKSGEPESPPTESGAPPAT